MKDVICIGSATKDVFLVSKGFKLIKTDKFETGVGECFAYGAKVEVGDIFFDTGGGATNAAATFSNFNLDVSIVSQVGSDLNGQEVIDDLVERGIEVKNIKKHDRLKTGYATILLAEKGDRTILVYRGAAQDFDVKLLPSSLKSKWVYLTSTAGNFDFNKKVFDLVQKSKSKVFWNPGGGEIKLGWKKLKPLLEKTEVLSLNKEEAEVLCGSLDLKSNLILLSTVIPIVVITDGKVGAYLATQGSIHFIPSVGTPPVNTTGAGDAFGSGFVSGMIMKDDWKYAVRLAILNSDGVIREMGAKHGLLTRLPTASQLEKIPIKDY